MGDYDESGRDGATRRAGGENITNGGNGRENPPTGNNGDNKDPTAASSTGAGSVQHNGLATRDCVAATGRAPRAHAPARGTIRVKRPIGSGNADPGTASRGRRPGVFPRMGLLEFNFGAGVFQLLLCGFGFGFDRSFQNGFGCAFHQGLGFSQTQTGLDFAHGFDDGDLLVRREDMTKTTSKLVSLRRGRSQRRVRRRRRPPGPRRSLPIFLPVV